MPKPKINAKTIAQAFSKKAKTLQTVFGIVNNIVAQNKAKREKEEKEEKTDLSGSCNEKQE